MSFALDPVLTGAHVSLLPLQASDAPRLLEAASDRCLWEMKLTVIPGTDTVEQHLALFEIAATHLQPTQQRRQVRQPLGNQMLHPVLGLQLALHLHQA